MQKYLLAHDIGTSGNKATLFTIDGELVASKVYSYGAKYFNGCWAEQNPEDWWDAVCNSTRYITQGIDKNQIAAISFSGHSNGCLCIDKNGNLLRNSIIHSDQRAVEEVKQISKKIDARGIYEITGNKLSPAFSIEKFMWVKNNEPEIYKNTYKMLSTKDYIVFKLTGEALTDYTDASMTGAFDLKTRKWSEKIIDITGIYRDKLPEIYDSTYVAGGITSKAAEEIGLKVGTPVVIGGGDGQTGFFGIAGTNTDNVYNYIGSTSTVNLASNQLVFDREMQSTINCHPVPGYYKYYATMQTAGTSYNWVKNEICVSEINKARRMKVSPYVLMDNQIEKSAPGANGIIFLPYLMGERSPYWNPNAKGAFIGLNAFHKREDILRAVLEGIAFNLNINLRTITKHLSTPIKSVVVYGGGAKGKIWRQIIADIFNVTVQRPNYLEEGASIGAAVLAGIGVGVFKDYDVINRFIKIGDELIPNKENREIYDRMQVIFENSYKALTGIYDELAALKNT